MAKSRFEYVRKFELPDPLLPNTYLIVRVDGRGFHQFSDEHEFEKPNDKRALDLMDRAARAVMDSLPDVVMAFGESDEYSNRLAFSSSVNPSYTADEAGKLHGFLVDGGDSLILSSKINSTIVSIFTSAYVFHWTTYMSGTTLRRPPSFDGRVVVYPGAQEIRDYFAWRQADTHINNLYNTAFWNLVKDGETKDTANAILASTHKDSPQKNELLFSRFGINYSRLPAQYRKGSILVRADSKAVVEETLVEGQGDGRDAAPGEAGADADQAPPRKASKAKSKSKAYDGLTGQVATVHEDIIKDAFWVARPWLLA